MKIVMKTANYITVVLLAFVLSQCGETEESEVQDITTVTTATNEWIDVEAVYVDTIRCAVSELPHLPNYMYLITTEEELEYLEQKLNYNQANSVNDLQSTTSVIYSLTENYLIEDYSFIFYYSTYGDSQFYHHSDAVQYNESLKSVQFHYDIMTTPPASDYCDDTIVAYMDIAVVPKSFFDRGQIDNLLNTKEMEEKWQQVLQNIR